MNFSRESKPWFRVRYSRPRGTRFRTRLGPLRILGLGGRMGEVYGAGFQLDGKSRSGDPLHLTSDADALARLSAKQSGGLSSHPHILAITTSDRRREGMRLWSCSRARRSRKMDGGRSSKHQAVDGLSRSQRALGGDGKG